MSIWILIVKNTCNAGHGEISVSYELATLPGTWGEPMKKAFESKNEALQYADEHGLFRAIPFELTL